MASARRWPLFPELKMSNAPSCLCVDAATAIVAGRLLLEPGRRVKKTEGDFVKVFLCLSLRAPSTIGLVVGRESIDLQPFAGQKRNARSPIFTLLK